MEFIIEKLLEVIKDIFTSDDEDEITYPIDEYRYEDFE